MITGDLMHHPIQCKYPEWDDGFDSDGAMAKKTRRAFCEKYADSNVVVFGTHFATPSAGKISKKGDSFTFTAAKLTAELWVTLHFRSTTDPTRR